ncbi:hypothetical protein C5167_005270 [Papaver somniferum]|uniref:Cyclin N-terminal domain-containing protein n=1 Tax=Papaver somniferum TaxID=3469 RepID=A0A4Y7JE08_PAPSO|nr:hypothetical protein C5167_005270 [Papaver somniferum]
MQFATISVWVSSKVTNENNGILQEVVLMQVLDFEIGASNVTDVFFEDFLTRLRGLLRVESL